MSDAVSDGTSLLECVPTKNSYSNHTQHKRQHDQHVRHMFDWPAVHDCLSVCVCVPVQGDGDFPADLPARFSRAADRSLYRGADLNDDTELRNARAEADYHGESPCAS